MKLGCQMMFFVSDWGLIINVFVDKVNNGENQKFIISIDF